MDGNTFKKIPPELTCSWPTYPVLPAKLRPMEVEDAQLHIHSWLSVKGGGSGYSVRGLMRDSKLEPITT